MFGSACLLLKTSRYLDTDNTPVLLELGEIQMCYVEIRHDVWLSLINDTTWNKHFSGGKAGKLN